MAVELLDEVSPISNLPLESMRSFSVEPSLFKNLVKVLSISNEPESFVFLNLYLAPDDV